MLEADFLRPEGMPLCPEQILFLLMWLDENLERSLSANHPPMLLPWFVFLTKRQVLYANVLTTGDLMRE